MIAKHGWLAVAGVVAFSGCFTFEGFDPDGGLPIDAGEPIVVPADPLTATGTLDSSRQVFGTFGWDAGGVLTTTAADGTVFTLTVPGTALTETTTISMTPWSTLDTGLGETSHGVKLEPAGLQGTTTFMELTITPPAGTTWVPAEQVPFTLQGSSDVVSLALVDPRSAPVKLLIGHFSSYGLALAKKGFSASLAAARHRLGGDVEAQLETEVAAALSLERQRQLTGAAPSGSLYDSLRDFLHRYIEQVVKPRLAAARDSCANARLATQTLLGLERQLQLLGHEGPSPIPFDWGDLFGLNVVCMKEEYELCRDNHIITRVIPSFLGVLRQEQLLGLGDEARFAPDRFECEQYVSKCLRFSLEVSSDVTYTEGSGADTYTMRESMHQPPTVTAQYVMTTDENPTGLTHVDASGAFITGSFSDFTVSGYQAQYQNACWSVTTTTPGGGQLAMTSLSFEQRRPPAGSFTGPADRAHVGDFFVVPALIPNSSEHVVSQRSRDSSTGTCSGTPSAVTVHDNWSTMGFGPWLTSLEGASADAYITGWTIIEGDIMATKSVQWSGQQGVTFNATFTLRHSPEPN